MQQSSTEKEKGSGKELMSAQEAEDLKMKEKRKQEREVTFFVVVAIILWEKKCSHKHN